MLTSSENYSAISAVRTFVVAAVVVDAAAAVVVAANAVVVYSLIVE